MNGPERSTTSEMKTTTPAVSAILKTSSSQNERSGDISKYYPVIPAERSESRNPYPLFEKYAPDVTMDSGFAPCGAPWNDRRSSPLQRDRDRRPRADGLIDHAISLRQLKQLVELVLRGVGIEIEAQPDLREADRRVLGDT